jgi:pimeloyl-ACP methyl ester carboxylesterase
MILQYKGINIFYTDDGKGHPIVFLHGFLENVSMWNPFIPELSKNNRVVCIDLLGHGKTDCLGYVHSMEAMAHTVKAVLDHLKIASQPSSDIPWEAMLPWLLLKSILNVLKGFV